MDRVFNNNDRQAQESLDLRNSGSPGLEQQKINIAVPDWMLLVVDNEAEKLGITRQATIKIWICEKIKSLTA
jgi:hypothetical protein